MAAPIALRVAGAIPIASISTAGVSPTPQANAAAWISTARALRWVALKSLLSRTAAQIPASGAAGGTMTAAATTGPASAPRPTSSIPATAR